jgi:hypothetical protein
VPAYTGNPALLISALLRFAATKGYAATWLADLQNTALAATTGNGDEYATSLTTEGGGSTWMRDIPPATMAQLCESALQHLEAAAAGTSSGLRGADFSQSPSVLG